MKRLSVLVGCAVLVLFFGMLSKQSQNASTEAKSKNMSYKVYVTSLDEVVQMPQNAQIVDLGFCYEIAGSKMAKTQNSKKTLGSTKTIACSKADINRILAKESICVQRQYNIEECVVFEGFVRNGVGKSTKVQIAYNNGKLSIGIPVIFGAY